MLEKARAAGFLLVVPWDCFLPGFLLDLDAVFEELAGVFVVEIPGVAGYGEVALPG